MNISVKSAGRISTRLDRSQMGELSYCVQEKYDIRLFTNIIVGNIHRNTSLWLPHLPLTHHLEVQPAIVPGVRKTEKPSMPKHLPPSQKFVRPIIVVTLRMMKRNSCDVPLSKARKTHKLHRTKPLQDEAREAGATAKRELYHYRITLFGHIVLTCV